MRIRATVASLAALLSGAAVAAELPLDEAVRLAIANNRMLQNGALETGRAGERVRAARTRQYPNFSLYALGGYELTPVDFTIPRGFLGVYPSAGPIPGKDAVLRTPQAPTGLSVVQVSQPLTQLHRIHLGIQLLKTVEALSEEQHRQARQDLVRDVKKLYYGLQQSAAGLKAVRETLLLYRELDRLVGKYVEQGSALVSDHLDVQARLAKAEETEIGLLNGEAGLKEQLNHLLGREVLTEFEVSPVATATSFDVDLQAARARALDQRAEIRQSGLRSRMADLDVRVKRAEHIPDISANFTNVALMNYSSFLPRQMSMAGFLMTWEPFDFGRKRHEVAEKQLVARQARNGSLEARSLVTIDVDARFRRLNEVRAQLRSTAIARQAALENLRVVKRRFELDAALAKDLLQAQAAVEQANQGHEQALAGFWTAKAELERAMGEDQ